MNYKQSFERCSQSIDKNNMILMTESFNFIPKSTQLFYELSRCIVVVVFIL